MVLNLMVLFLFLILNIFIFYFWFWLFDNIFKIKNKIFIFFITLLFGSFSGLLIVFYPDILNWLNFSFLDFTNKSLETLSDVKTLLFFWIWISLIILISFLIFGKIKNKIFWKEFFIFSIIFILIGLASIKALTSDEMIYYVYVALGEEFSKFLLATIIFSRYGIVKSDIILFSVLTAIGFAFIENFVYLLGIIGGKGLAISLLVGGLGILLTRGVIGFLAHSVFTGNIGFLTYKGLNDNKKILIFVAPMIGIIAHYLYDLGLTYGVKIVIPILLIIGYIWISYLFYKSDRLYANYYENISYK